MDGEKEYEGASGEAGKAAAGASLSQRLVRWTDTFLGVILQPANTFQALAREAPGDKSLIVEAALTVLLVFAIDGARLYARQTPGLVALGVLDSILSGIILWLAMIAIPFVVGKWFHIGPGKPAALAVTTGWAFLPWMFVAPLSLWSALAGSTLTVIVAVLLYGWMVFLFWLAVRQTFALTDMQVMCLVILVPQLIAFMALLWLVQIVSDAVSFVVM